MLTSKHELVRIPTADYRTIYSFLDRYDPWHIIALEALIKGGLQHPEQHWFAETIAGKLCGILFAQQYNLHFAYDTVPSVHSPVYAFMEQFYPKFYTHGSEAIVTPIMQRLKHQHTCIEKSQLVVQTNATLQRIQQTLPKPKGIKMCLATLYDHSLIKGLFAASEVEQQVDHCLVKKLISAKRVLLAVRSDELLGVIMCLKETQRYALLGNLYVKPKERGKLIASLLGQHMVSTYVRRGKTVCFYYSNPQLASFYNQAAFQPIGSWVHYSATSNIVI